MTAERTEFPNEAQFRAALNRKYRDVVDGRRSEDRFARWLDAVRIGRRPLRAERVTCFRGAVQLMLAAYRSDPGTPRKQRQPA